MQRKGLRMGEYVIVFQDGKKVDEDNPDVFFEKVKGILGSKFEDRCLLTFTALREWAVIYTMVDLMKRDILYRNSSESVKGMLSIMDRELEDTLRAIMDRE